MCQTLTLSAETSDIANITADLHQPGDAEVNDQTAKDGTGIIHYYTKDHSTEIRTYTFS